MEKDIRKKLFAGITTLAMLVSLLPVAALPVFAADDTTAPTVSVTTITPSDVSQTGVTLSWAAAEDNATAQNNLRYLVYRSYSSDLNTVDDFQTHGTPLGSYTAGITTKSVTGLTPNTIYYFNVIVKDEAGNEACYATATATTGAATAVSFEDGNGTPGNPYQIKTAEQLAYAAYLTNNASTYDANKDACYKLIQNISVDNFTPIGIWNRTDYKGTFDGGGYTVTLNDSAMEEAELGLFGCVGIGGTVKNLTVSCNVTDSCAGDVHIGAIAARNYGTISGCTVTGTLTGALTGEATAASGTKNSGIYIGGITAASFGNIESCTAECTIDGRVSTEGNKPYVYLGGIAAICCGCTVDSCSAVCTVKGNAGSEGCTTNGYTYIGGLVGSCRDEGTFTKGSTIKDCTASCATTGAITTKSGMLASNYVGGLVGVCDFETSIEGCSSSGSVTSTAVSTSSGKSCAYAGGLVGLCEVSSTIKDSSSSCSVKGDSSKGTGGASAYAGGLVGYTYVATIQNSHASGNVSGSGANSLIGGLVGMNQISSAVTDSSITGSYATGAVTGSGTYSISYAYFGGLTGWNIGKVDSSYATGNVTSSGASCAYCGGLAGYNTGTVSTSYATSAVSVINTSYAICGGLVGNNTGTVGNCYTRGDVSASSSTLSYEGGLVGWNQKAINACYSTGEVSGTGSGTKDIGGFVGLTSGSSATITDGYYDKQNAGQQYAYRYDSEAGSSSVTGRTAAEMTGTAVSTNMSSLAFTGVDAKWKTKENTDEYWYYPQLQNFTGFESVTLPLAVSPAGSGVSPADGSSLSLYGTHSFTFPFTTAGGKLSELDLDIYLGDDTGADRSYSDAASISLPASSSDVEGMVDDINNQFQTKTREELVTDYGGGTAGENKVRLYEAAGFSVGENNAAAVKANIKYTAASSSTGTWTLTLSTGALKTNKLEILAAVKNNLGKQWGNNDFATHGDLTKAYIYSLYVPESTGGSGSGSSDSSGTDTTIRVDDNSVTAGTSETTTNTDGQTVTTVTVDTDKLDDILESKGNGAKVTIPVTGGSDVAAGTLTGKMVKNMENKKATLVVETDSGAYTLPASEIDIDTVSQQLGADVSLSDIDVTVSISEPSASMTQVVENAAQDGGYTIMAPSVDYTITCTHGEQTVSVSSFSAYVERTIAIPEGVDPNKITTGIVVEPDGTVHHVPTRITIKNGMYYAVINSLTNSTYSVIWNPVEFSDVTNHWAKDAVNDMGSRMVVSGTGGNNFAPDRDITRAEFAVIMVRALGLEPGSGASGFSDVGESDWFCSYIITASKYGLITGYPDNTFRPNDNITREQAMAVAARAMKLTKLETSAADAAGLLAGFTDSASVSSYAAAGIAACISSGVVNGRPDGTIAPQDNITRAEVAVIAERLLKKSELI